MLEIVGTVLVGALILHLIDDEILGVSFKGVGTVTEIVHKTLYMIWGMVISLVTSSM